MNRISVIVPMYNTGKYIGKCLESLLAQTYGDIQVIVVNDGSKDDSLEAVRRFAARDRRICIIDKEHEGVSAARNAGLKAADGEIVSIVDSDDWLDVNAYEVMYGIMAENNADVVYCEWCNEYSDGSSDAGKNQGDIVEVYEGEEILRQYMKKKINGRANTTFARKRALQGVSFKEELSRGEDMLFTFETLCRAQKAVYTNFPFYHRYNRVGSLSNKKFFEPRDMGLAECTEYMLDYLKENNWQYIQDAYIYAFSFYMVTLNGILYYKSERDYPDLFRRLNDRLGELYSLIKKPAGNLPFREYIAFHTYRLSKEAYRIVDRIYYRYVKQEKESKRQR